MPFIEFEITKHFDGRGNGEPVKNSYVRQTQVAIEHDTVAAAALGVSIAEKVMALENLHFMSVIARVIMLDNYTPVEGVYRTFDLLGVGSRAIVGNVAERELCALIRRRTAAQGSGRVELRGSLLESDLITSTNGTKELAPSAPGNARQSIGSYNNQLMSSTLAGNWVMIPPPGKRHLPPRIITSFDLVGVKHRQLEMPRTSIASAKAQLLLRELKRMARQVRSLFTRIERGLATLAGIIGELQSIWDEGKALIQNAIRLGISLFNIPAFFMNARPAAGA
jgi:hypothetical protein